MRHTCLPCSWRQRHTTQDSSAHSCILSTFKCWFWTDWTRLDYCNATFTSVANEQITHLQKIQNNAAWLVIQKIEARSYDITFERTPPAPEYMLPWLWWHSLAISVLFSHYLPIIAFPPFFNRTTAQDSKEKFERFWWTFVQLYCSYCGTQCQLNWELHLLSKLSKPN